MQEMQAQFGAWVKRGFSLFLENLGVLIAANLVAAAISLGSVGLLAGPMLAGVALLELDIVRGRPIGGIKAGVKRVFDGFDFFLPSLLLVLIEYGALSMAEHLWLPLVFALSHLVIMPLTLFALYLIVDTKADVVTALQQNYKRAGENFPLFVALHFAAMLLSASGIIIFGIGALLTLPLGGMFLAVVYHETFGAKENNLV